MFLKHVRGSSHDTQAQTASIFSTPIEFVVVLYLVLIFLESIFPGSISFTAPTEITSLLAAIAVITLLLTSDFNKIPAQQKNGYFILFGLIIFFIFVVRFKNFFPFSALVGIFILVTSFFVYLYLNKHDGDFISFFSFPHFSKLHFLLAIPFSIFLVVCFYRYLTPSGVIQYRYEANESTQGNITLSSQYPLAFGKDSSGKSFVLADNSTTISARLPRSFSRASIEVIYKPFTNGQINLLSKNAFNWYSVNPFVDYDADLYSLPPYWQKIESGSLVLWQKNSQLKQAYETNQLEYSKQLAELETNYANTIELLDRKYSAGIYSTDSYNRLTKAANETLSAKKDELRNKFTINSELAPPKYATINSFLDDDTKNYRTILASNYSLEDSFQLNEEITESHNTPLLFDKSIRGRHALIFFQPQSGPFQFTVNYHDVNLDIGNDVAQLILYHNLNSIKSSTVPDDGITSNNAVTSSQQHITLGVDNLARGLYTVTFSGSPDLFIDAIKSTTDLVAFDQHFYYSGNNNTTSFSKPIDKAMTIYSNSSVLRIFNDGHDEANEIIVNGRTYNATKSNDPLVINDLPPQSQIIVPAGSYSLSGDGIFSLLKDNPLLRYMNKTTKDIKPEDLDKTDYIIARYLQPTVQGNADRILVTISEPELGFHNNTSEFKLDFADLPDNTYAARIYEINITFEKDPLTIKNFIHKIVAKIQSLL